MYSVSLFYLLKKTLFNFFDVKIAFSSLCHKDFMFNSSSRQKATPSF